LVCKSILCWGGQNLCVLVKEDDLGAVLNNHPGNGFESQAMESVEMIEEKVSVEEAQVVRKAEEGM
jgi:hypothetical protein